jgi:hypothetical protein
MSDLLAFRIRRLYLCAEMMWRTVPPEHLATAILRIRAWAAQLLDTEAANDSTYI